MLPRPVVMTGLLGAAVAGPIALTEGPKNLGGFSGWSLGGAAATDQAAPPAGYGLTPPVIASPEGPGSLVYQSPAPLEGARSLTIPELLRMDVTKEWVYANWARKSTGLADPGLFGVRAPVVTGTRQTDLAGSISYYFGETGRVDRLRFHGRTADTTELIAVLQNYYGMQLEPAAPGEQLYRAKSGGRVLSELRTRPEPVLWSTAPHESFLVDLELNRPGSGRYVEPKLLTPNLPPPPAPPQPPAPPADPQQAAVAEAATEAEPPEADAAVDAPSLQNARRPPFRWPN